MRIQELSLSMLTTVVLVSCIRRAGRASHHRPSSLRPHLRVGRSLYRSCGPAVLERDAKVGGFTQGSPRRTELSQVKDAPCPSDCGDRTALGSCEAEPDQCLCSVGFLSLVPRAALSTRWYALGKNLGSVPVHA
jgi:hypothetical protein